MATIPRAALDYVTEQVNGLSADAQAKVLKVLESIEWTPDNIAECRDLVIQALAAVMPTYTDAAAQASADFYDASRELATGAPLGAQAISGYDPSKTEGAVRGFVRFVLDGRVQTFNDQVLQRIDYEMKLSAANSTLENGRRDPLKPKYARVPTGSETCDFCLMLASRGFVYHTESTASMGHVHSNCDCRIVADWDDATFEGYDPDEVYDRWKKAVGEKAARRAEANGTDVDDEVSKIMKSYGEAAKNAKRGYRKDAANEARKRTSRKKKADIDASGMDANAIKSAVSDAANGKTVVVGDADVSRKYGGIVSANTGYVANEDDFFDATAAVFRPAKRPDREPDYVSGSGSRYWYQDGGVYRESDHWGAGVASCNWAMEGRNEFTSVTGGKYGFAAQHSLTDDSVNNGPGVGFCRFEDFARVDDVMPTTAYISYEGLARKLEEQGYVNKDYEWTKDGKRLSKSEQKKLDGLKQKITSKSKSKVEYA